MDVSSSCSCTCVSFFIWSGHLWLTMGHQSSQAAHLYRCAWLDWSHYWSYTKSSTAGIICRIPHSKRNYVERVHAEENRVLSKHGPFSSKLLYPSASPGSKEHKANMENMTEKIAGLALLEAHLDLDRCMHTVEWSELTSFSQMRNSCRRSCRAEWRKEDAILPSEIHSEARWSTYHFTISVGGGWTIWGRLQERLPIPS